MPNSESELSESDEKLSSGEENEEASRFGEVSSYERQRLERIEQNKSRMEALGLKKMADSLMSSALKSPGTKREKRGRKKTTGKDEEYSPTQEDEAISSSGDDEFSLSDKKKVKRNHKKSYCEKTVKSDADFVDDDESLMQAIALSLEGSFDQLSKASNLKSVGSSSKRKTKTKTMTSRVQMTEDEMLVHFFQFDETGKGGITLRDVKRLATAHDFTWSHGEISDMISFFDSNGDGKVSLEDFRNMVVRCNMLKGSCSGDEK